METTDNNTTSTGQNPPADDQQNYALASLQSELEAAKTRLSELTTISQQALADLQNFKKRTEDEKNKFIAFSNASLIGDLIPVMDNINRAITHIPEDPAAKEWATGIIATTKQLESILEARGLQKIQSIGQKFDPAIHEALMTEAGPADQVLRELETGYQMQDRILRRAKVTVGKDAAPTPENNSEIDQATNTEVTPN